MPLLFVVSFTLLFLSCRRSFRAKLKSLLSQISIVYISERRLILLACRLLSCQNQFISLRDSAVPTLDFSFLNCFSFSTQTGGNRGSFEPQSDSASCRESRFFLNLFLFSCFRSSAFCSGVGVSLPFPGLLSSLLSRSSPGISFLPSTDRRLSVLPSTPFPANQSVWRREILFSRLFVEDAFPLAAFGMHAGSTEVCIDPSLLLYRRKKR